MVSITANTGGGGSSTLLSCFLALVVVFGTLYGCTFSFLLLCILGQQLLHHRICCVRLLFCQLLLLCNPVEVAQGRDCIGVALCCSERKQPPRLSKVRGSYRSVAVHSTELSLGSGVALHCGKLEQPPRLRKVLWSALT